MRTNTLALSLCGLLVTGSPLLAEGSRIVGPLPGYRCMMLYMTPDQAVDPNFQVRYYAAPSESAPDAGLAMAEVAVRDPVQQVNGFVAARFPTGATVWIKANMVVPYHSLSDPTIRCRTVILQNGHSGFDFYR